MKYVVFSIVIFVFLQANCTTIFPFQQDKGSGEFFEQKEGKLTLNAPTETAKRQWIFPFEAIKNTQWQLTISLDFEPSTSNYMDWYLVASEQNLESSTAYFIRWGMTGNEDVLQFFKQKNGQKTLLAQGKTIVSKGGKIQLLVFLQFFFFWIDPDKVIKIF